MEAQNTLGGINSLVDLELENAPTLRYKWNVEALETYFWELIKILFNTKLPSHKNYECIMHKVYSQF